MADFCSIADMADFLQIEIPEAKEASAARAITEATAVIVNYCRQALEQTEDDEVTLDGTGTSKLLLPELPATAVDSVVEDDDELDSDEFKLGQHGILHRVGAAWPRGVQNIVVTYTHGYETIPDDVASICVRAAARAYQAGLKTDDAEGVPGVASMGLGDYNVAFGAEGGGTMEGILGASAAMLLLPSERRVLNRYRA